MAERSEGMDVPLERRVGRVKCLDCGLPYADFPIDVVLPDEQWRAITGRTDGGGILCAGCIVARGARLPGATVARMQFDAPNASLSRAHAASEPNSTDDSRKA